MFDDLYNILNPETRCHTISSLTASISNIVQILANENADVRNKSFDIIAKIIESQK